MDKKKHDTRKHEKNARKRAEMQCSDVNPGAVQKAEPHPREICVKLDEKCT